MNPCRVNLIVQMQWPAVLRVYPHRLNRGCWRSIPRCHSVLHAVAQLALLAAEDLRQFSCHLQSVGEDLALAAEMAEVMVAAEVIHLKLPSPGPSCLFSPEQELFLPVTANADFRALLQLESREWRNV